MLNHYIPNDEYTNQKVPESIFAELAAMDADAIMCEDEPSEDDITIEHAIATTLQRIREAHSCL
jgi:hypothetical protein